MPAHKSSRGLESVRALVCASIVLPMALAGCSRDELAPDCSNPDCSIPWATEVGVDCASLPTPLAVGADYTFTLEANGGSGQYGNWMVGNLPPGLTLDPNTGVISGTPTDPPYPGNQGIDYALDISVEDEVEGTTYEATCDLTVNPRLNSLPTKLSDYRCLDYQTAFQDMVAALEGGDGTDITCSIGNSGGATCPIGDGDGRLAPGISFDASTCTHSGSITGDRYGTWVWMIDVTQSGYTTTVPFCATNDVDTFHDIILTANGVDDDPLKPALYEYDPDEDLGFGSSNNSGDYHWDINSPDCVGTPAECNNFGFRFDVTCSPFDVSAPWSISLSPSMGGGLGLSHEMSASGPAPGDAFRARPWVASFEMAYCTSSDGSFCATDDVAQFEQNAQTKYHFDVVAFPVDQ